MLILALVATVDSKFLVY